MTDHKDIWQREEPQSPCVNICVLKQDVGLCVGCYRTADEIATWSRLSIEERRQLLTELPNRKALLAPKRKGGRRSKSP